MAPPISRKVSKTIGHDIDEPSAVDATDIDVIDAQNRSPHFDIDLIDGGIDGVRSMGDRWGIDGIEGSMGPSFHTHHKFCRSQLDHILHGCKNEETPNSGFLQKPQMR